jgi:hypothetical protein
VLTPARLGLRTVDGWGPVAESPLTRLGSGGAVAIGRTIKRLAGLGAPGNCLGVGRTRPGRRGTFCQARSCLGGMMINSLTSRCS